MSHIFISYSKADIDFARHLRRLLEREGFAVWMDEARLVPSSRWWPEIEHNIDSCDAFLVIMSPHGKDSDWVEREILHAERIRKPVFPVLLTGEVWSRLANIQYTDMRDALSTTLPPGMVQSLRGVVTPGQAPPQLPHEGPRSSIPDRDRKPAAPLPAPRDLTPPPTPRARSWRDRLVRGVIRGGVIVALVIVAIFALEALLGGNATVNDHDDSAENGAPPRDQNGSLDELRSILIEQLHSPDRDAVQEAMHRLDQEGWLFDGSLAGIDLSHVDLSGMDLNGVQLPGANFNEANLMEARFQEANLTEARFEGAMLVGTVMIGANLEDARIIHADARGMQLTGANLRGAQMVFTNFEESNLNEADLRSATLEQSNIRWTVIDGTQFSTETVLPDGRPWQPGTDMGRYLLPEHPDFWRSDDLSSPAHF